jgi:membrane protease YdiL (CAAX protease family)
MARRAAARVGHAGLPPGLLAVARIVGASLAYLAVLDTLAIAAYALGQTLVPETARGSFGLIGLGLAELAALVTVLGIWRVVDRRPVRQLGLGATASKQSWLRGAAVATLMMCFVVLVGYTLIDAATWGVNPDPVRAAIVLIAGFAGFAVQGPSEEVLFRGYMLENVREQWGVRWAVVVSSLAFGIFHAPNPGFGLLPFINLALFGLGTALYRLYVDRGQLWGVFAIHTVWNWLQQVVFGLPNSGISSTRDDSLFSVTPNASLPDALWGGGFGPEGTLAASLVLLGLVCYAARRGGFLKTTSSPPPEPAPSSLDGG